jgi:hypothetical protein
MMKNSISTAVRLTKPSLELLVKNVLKMLGGVGVAPGDQLNTEANLNWN